MSDVDWREFWHSYRAREISSEADLFFEVGRTVNQQPVSAELFQISIQRIASQLDFQGNDRLLELCCGNGLITYQIASRVQEVRGVDFAERLITHARQFHAHPNVQYICADAIDFIEELAANGSFVPTKVLLGDALGYFDPAGLRRILNAAGSLNRGDFAFLATGIPADELKWNFYNTAERIERYRENQEKSGNTNDGIGRWWSRSELETIAREQRLELTLSPQPDELSNFRIDALFVGRGSRL